ncbi:hypothetical protein MP228_003905 [Amoeboaphelidium protococcarum]|nr:hypothetical protein MP228_003905 [Amoeboaphelidium protococcarum]
MQLQFSRILPESVEHNSHGNGGGNDHPHYQQKEAEVLISRVHLPSHNKYIVVGTMTGRVMIIDHSGIVIKSQLKGFHRTQIVSISSYTSSSQADTIVSASLDGEIIVQELDRVLKKFAYVRPIKCILMVDASQFVFTAADGKLLKCFGNSKFTVINQLNVDGEYYESIISIQDWGGVYILTTTSGLVYQLAAAAQSSSSSSSLSSQGGNSQMIKLIHNASQKQNVDLSLSNEDKRHTCNRVVARYNALQKCLYIAQRQTIYLYNQQLQNVKNARLDYGIVDMQFISDSYLSLLVQRTQDMRMDNGQYSAQTIGNNNNYQQQPILQIIETKKFAEVASTLISFISTTKSGSNISQLLRLVSSYVGNAGAQSTSSSDFDLLVSTPYDLILVKQKSQNDILEQLLDEAKYQEALDLLRDLQNPNSDDGRLISDDFYAQQQIEYTVEDVAQLYVNSLLSLKRYEDGAQILRENVQSVTAWEQCIYRYVEEDQLPCIIPEIPQDIVLCLEQNALELILGYCALNDTPRFLRFISPLLTSSLEARQVQSGKQFDFTEIMSLVDDVFSQKMDDLHFCQAAYLLYERQARYKDCCVCLMALNDDTSIDGFIKTWDIRRDLPQILLQYLSYDKSRVNDSVKLCIYMLAEDPNQQSASTIIDILSGQEQALIIYLDHLYDFDAPKTVQYHDLMVKLYAQLIPDRLLRFLRISNAYDLSKALKVCQQHSLIDEMVYILSKIGDLQRALNVLFQTRDVVSIVNFCLSVKDEDVWQRVMEQSSQWPELLQQLLVNAYEQIDILKLLSFIGNDARLTKAIQDALISSIKEFKSTLNLLVETNVIYQEDYLHLLVLYLKRQRKARAIRKGVGDGDGKCSLCNQPLLLDHNAGDTAQDDDSLAILKCSHQVHSSCLQERQTYTCNYCTQQI